MKRFTTVLLGTALAAALSFGAQSNPPAKAPADTMADHAKTTTSTVKKHSKKKKAKTTASGEAHRAASSSATAPKK
jgi:hypothetical protein